ncbi:hypothetical protein V6Z12_D11G334300 [Gossypium hirsutum]
MKDHIFIRYFSRDYLYPISLENKCGKHDGTKNLRTTDCLDQECYQLELSFISVHCRLVKVKKCGVRIVYEKDLEEIQELHSSQCCAKDGSIGNGSLMKRKHNINEEMNEGPQPKLIKKNSIL